MTLESSSRGNDNKSKRLFTSFGNQGVGKGCRSLGSAKNIKRLHELTNVTAKIWNLKDSVDVDRSNRRREEGTLILDCWSETKPRFFETVVHLPHHVEGKSKIEWVKALGWSRSPTISFFREAGTDFAYIARWSTWIDNYKTDKRVERHFKICPFLQNDFCNLPQPFSENPGKDRDIILRKRIECMREKRCVTDPILDIHISSIFQEEGNSNIVVWKTCDEQWSVSSLESFSKNNLMTLVR